MPRTDSRSKTPVLIIGGGVTGTGLARDLALRGVPSVLVEKRDINAGASGGNHGLLHSGARYLASDPHTAEECRDEGELLKRLAPHCIEETGGLFVAVEGDDERYMADFPNLCRRHDIPFRELDPHEAREWEPELSQKLIASFHVSDASINPFRLSLGNLEQALQKGGTLLTFTRAAGFFVTNRRIRAVTVRNDLTGEERVIEADVVVNAGGAWAGKIAALAGIRLPMRCSKGSLLVTAARLTRRVINRLRSPSDGDILMPAGTVSVLGTTSERVHSPDRIFPELREIDLLIEQGSAMVPALETARAIRAYCGVRALSGGKEGGDDRDASRGFLLLDHAEGEERIENLITITGGKLTTFRLMAEKTADRVCEKLGISEPCRTAEEPLPDAKTARWTEPGLAPRTWVRSGDCSDAPLCLCELVPENVVEDLAEALEEEGARPNLRALGVRSRVGKGPCQGTFCSQRIAARLYDRGTFSGREGIAQLRAFLSERWRGRRLLLEDASLAQAELLEAMHCALFGLELEEEGGGPLRREEDRHDRA